MEGCEGVSGVFRAVLARAAVASQDIRLSYAEVSLEMFDSESDRDELLAELRDEGFIAELCAKLSENADISFLRLQILG